MSSTDNLYWCGERCHGLRNAVRFLGVLCAVWLAAPAGAQTVNWLDPLGYKKPAPLTVNEPNEASVPNKYWVDLSNGSGSTCSQSSPCGAIANVIGKPGTNGGPAVIYVKGTGGMSLYNDTLQGSGDADCRSASCANWILIRNWPAGTPGCTSECSATITGNSNMNSPSGVSHIVIDGGPNLKIAFNSNGATATYVNHVIANYVIVYRTQTYCTGSNQQLGWSVGDSPASSHVYFINNEFYGCGSTGDQISAVYVGPGSSGGYTDFAFQNNIVRNFYGDGLEINPRVTSTGLTITGNAIHDVGFGTCGNSWLCRPGITVSIQSGGGNNNTVIENNLIWNTASGCIWDRGGGTPKPLIANNTCYNYGTGSSASNPNPQGISGYSNGGTAVVENNILYAPNGTVPFDGSSFSASHNVCAGSCGSASQTWNSTTVLSTDPTSSNFMVVASGSSAVGKGVVLAGLTTAYSGGTRSTSSFDIGAFASGTAATAKQPDPPTNVTATIN
jgi:hypothetical protein